MMHQALLSLTSPFPLYCFTNGKTAIVLLLLLLLLLCSDAPLRCSSTQHTSSVPLLMSHHHPIRPLLFVSTAVNEWSSASVTVRGSADNQPVLGVYRPPCSRSERSKAKRSEAKRSGTWGRFSIQACVTEWTISDARLPPLFWIC